VYDGTGDEHYDVASAFIKSLRGSDPDAAIYWMARMLEAGADPRFIARRLVIQTASPRMPGRPREVRARRLDDVQRAVTAGWSAARPEEVRRGRAAAA
jgi:hypothetical protein